MPDLRSFMFSQWSDEYEKNLPHGVRKAYEAAEKAFKEKTGTNYFSSFESFKSSRTIRRKKGL